MHYKIKHIFCTLFAMLLYSNSYAQSTEVKKDSIDRKEVTLSADTLSFSLPKNDTLTAKNDSVAVKKSKKTKKDPKTFVFEPSKDAIESEITYSASDSIVFVGGGDAFLYGKASINYQTLELNSDNISLDIENSTVKARGKIDSTGALVETPIFKDGPDEYESESMDYNYKSGKGLIRGVITQQQDGYITSDKARKNPDNTFLMRDGKYTTCDNHDNPHFYLNLTKAKVVPKNCVVTGPAYFVLLDVPIPLVIPFAYFPFSSAYKSGLLMPTFGEDSRQGFYLRNGGYYFAINDYVDLAVRGDIYTKGSWGVNGTSRYIRRYKHSGNLLFSYQVTGSGEKGMPNYTEMKDMKIRWTHKQDAKANPFSTFSASVNYSTSAYNKNNTRSYYNASSYAENNKSSSINFAYQFPESVFSLQTNLTVNQRQSDSTLSITFPSLTVSMNRIYPFQRKVMVGSKKWYEKIYFNYNFNAENSVSMKQDKLMWSSEIQSANDFFTDLEATHKLSFGASYNILKYLVLSPNISYNEKWYHKTQDLSWNENLAKVDTAYHYGLFFKNDFSASVNLNTTLYGFYKPLKWMGGKKIAAIRHMCVPTVGFSYRPEFDHMVTPFPGMRDPYYGSYIRPVPGMELSDVKPIDYARMRGGGTHSNGPSGNVNLSLSNNVEMKVRSDRDTTGYKKISLIDNLMLSTSYNVFADSLNWSDISANVRFKLPGNTTFSVNSRWTPYTYQLNDYGSPTRVDVTEMEKNHRLARMTNASTSLSYNFNNNTFKKKEKPEDQIKGEPTSSDEYEDTDPDVLDKQGPRRLRDKKKDDSKKDDEGYEKFSLPWNLNISASVSYGDKKFNKERLTYEQDWSCMLNFSGSFTFTRNWSFNYSSGYDVIRKEISYTTCGISRSLHCWSASLNLVPFGYNQSFNFTIHANSSLLQDLKYEKSSSPSDHPSWY